MSHRAHHAVPIGQCQTPRNFGPCRVDFEETVLIGGKAESSRKRRREGHLSQQSASEEVFHPFYCLLCNAKLGLYDSDEVFHFVGVIASEP